MALKLHIPPCIDTPPHPNHPPSPGCLLRIHIQGPRGKPFPQPAVPELAELAFRAIHGRPIDTNLGVSHDNREFDYYGVTFRHRIPENETDFEVLAVNIIEIEEDSREFASGIEYARKYLRVQVDAEEYFGTKVLAVPRCCQKKRGTTDRARINSDIYSEVTSYSKGIEELIGKGDMPR
ncbi:hypothetical protein BDY21DRAFT_417405 [Lineolata rhizophorae]|uniref:Uncharacterized protein n=1 Tax=Lineolata rhizophorae TaxID=578093 RepID=A0A6A6NMQ1_9PEZI|nr:hypothetical protein BDY21DRAFT_417405 [Lineolata rhizophorae]